MTRAASASRLLWALLIVVLVTVVGAWVGSRWLWPELTPAPLAAELPSYGSVAAFRLTDQLGRTFDSAELTGTAWVADFVFTRCSGPCPMLTQNLAGLIDTLGIAFPARYITFTVDPEYDSPEVLKEYGDRFHADPARWRFLTGPRPAISAISVGSFHMAMGDPEISTLARPAGTGTETGTEPEEDGAPADSTETLNIPHSVRLALVDEAGVIRGYYDGTDPEAVEKLRLDIRQLVGLRT